MEKAVEKAKTLMEALPFITKFRGKTFVIKYGGNAMAKALENISKKWDWNQNLLEG